jgi:serine protease Do
MAEKLLPAVVSIEAMQSSTDTNSKDPSLQQLLKQFFGHQNLGNNGGGAGSQAAISLGSGFIIDPAGYVVTNNHVIEGAQEITVRTEDRTQ